MTIRGVMEVDSDTDTIVSIADIIADIEKCIDILTDIEQTTVFTFNEPTPESERAEIWRLAQIEASCTLLELPGLLGRLQEVPRKKQWFVFLHWVFYGEPPLGSAAFGENTPGV